MSSDLDDNFSMSFLLKPESVGMRKKVQEEGISEIDGTRPQVPLVAHGSREMRANTIRPVHQGQQQLRFHFNLNFGSPRDK
jgi:hypothetical protein